MTKHQKALNLLRELVSWAKVHRPTILKISPKKDRADNETFIE
jgi:hypothetical protein